MKIRRHLLLLLIAPVSCSAQQAGTEEAAIRKALEACLPSAAEIESDRADTARLPAAIRELTYVDYRMGECQRLARVCTETPDTSACREFLDQDRHP